jgi:hypothetical protein
MGPAALAQALRGGVVLHLVASCVVFLEGGCGGPTVVLDQLIGAGTSTSHEQHTRPSSASLLSLRACWTEASPAAVATRGWAAMSEPRSRTLGLSSMARFYTRLEGEWGPPTRPT